MRKRIVLTAVAVALAAAILFGVPVAWLSERYVRTSHLQRLEITARAVAQAVDQLQARHERISGSDLLIPGTQGDHVALWRGNERLLDVGPQFPTRRALTAEFISASGLVVQVSEPLHVADSDVRSVRLTLGGIGILAMALAVLLGAWQANRLSQSLRALVADAARLGKGDFRPSSRHFKVPELDQIAIAFNTSANRIGAMLARERQLSQDASHQLRTPLTALSMRLEEIQAADDLNVVAKDAQAALEQVMRLTQVVDQLLTQRHGLHSDERQQLWVDRVIRHQTDEWRPSFAGSGRRLRLSGQPGLSVHATPSTLLQVMAILLENALIHGAGTVTIHRRLSGGSVVIEVGDEGAGVPSHLGHRVFERGVTGNDGTGVGLALARDLTQSDGGRIELLRWQPALFGVFLPAARPRGAELRGGLQRALDAPTGEAGRL